MPTPSEAWTGAEAYERYIGRWSRVVASEFLSWLGIEPGGRWLDVGCGTGALSVQIRENVSPAWQVGLDPSPAYLARARAALRAHRAAFVVADARKLPLASGSFDVIVSGLVLNFVPDPAAAVVEMTRVARTGGRVALYVWDYAGDMELLRHFWDAAAELDPQAAALDEGARFPFCQPDALAELLRNGGLEQVEVRPIDVPTTFHDFDDYWSPFLGGQGPAPGYVAALSESGRVSLRERLRDRLSHEADGSIRLRARAWAARGLR